MIDLTWFLSNALIAVVLAVLAIKIGGSTGTEVMRPMADGGRDLLDQGVKDDLDAMKQGGSNGDSNGRENALSELGRLHSESESSLPQWAEYGIYAALIIAIVQIYVGIPIPDGTLLVAIGLGFLALGLWAGYKLREPLGKVADRFNEWRDR